MEFTLGTLIFDAVDAGLDTVMTTGLASFANLIAPVIGAMVSLYAVIIALNYMWSGSTSDMPVGGLLKRLFYLALFTLFAFNVTYYNTVIVQPVGSIGGEIAEVFSSSSATSPQIIDQMGTQIFQTIAHVWEKTPDFSLMNMDIVPFIKAINTIIIVGFFGMLFMAVSFLYLMVAKILVSLVLLLGPLFISMAFFPVTREYFMKWVGQLLNYTLLYAMFGITFTLLTNLLQSFVSGADFSGNLIGDGIALKLMFCYLIFTGVIITIGSLTSSLTGGVGISGLVPGGLGMAASRMMGGGGRGARIPAAGGGNVIGGGGNRNLG